MLTFDTFYPSDIHITDQTLLLNIETTGLSPRNAFVFMIGLGWQEEKGWHFQCLLAEKKMEFWRYPVHLNHAQFERLKGKNDFQQAVPYHSEEFTEKTYILF